MKTTYNTRTISVMVLPVEDPIYSEMATMREQLAASQLREQGLREALEQERSLRIFGQSPECGQTHWESLRDMRRAVYAATDAALSAPTDTAALDMVRKEERERAAILCETELARNDGISNLAHRRPKAVRVERRVRRLEEP